MRVSGIPSVAQRCTVETGWPRNLPMAAHPFNDSSDSFCLNMSEHLKRVSKGRAYKCLCLAVDQTTQPSGGVAKIHFDLDCHSPSTAPVGSRMKLSQPMPTTSVTSFMISPPNDFAFFVAARMSSTST